MAKSSEDIQCNIHYQISKKNTTQEDKTSLIEYEVGRIGIRFFERSALVLSRPFFSCLSLLLCILLSSIFYIQTFLTNIIKYMELLLVLGN